MVILLVNLPLAKGVIDALIHYSSESWIYVTAFGLMLAFVDLEIISKYAYYFIPLTIFNLIGLVILSVGIIPQIPKGHNFFTDEVTNDYLWMFSGPFFAYYIVRKFKTERSAWKIICVSAGIFIVSVILMTVISHIIGGFFPKDNKFGQWIKGDKPTENRQNTGF